MNITFLGAGAFGTALALVATNNHHKVKFYDPFKFPKITLEDAIKDAAAIVYVAPSNQASKILPKLDPKVPLICASKGFVSLDPFKKFEQFSVLSGAAFAEDIEAVITKNSQETVTLTATSQLAQEIFTNSQIKIEYTPDTLGVLICGALKNVYAIGAGLLQSGPEAKPLSEFLASVINELSSILTANGSSQKILQYSCGISDLTLTCSPRSRNFRFGQALKLNQATKPELVEGVATIKIISKTPDFILPENATIIREIIKTVEKNYATSNI